VGGKYRNSRAPNKVLRYGWKLYGKQPGSALKNGRLGRETGIHAPKAKSIPKIFKRLKIIKPWGERSNLCRKRIWHQNLTELQPETRVKAEVLSLAVGLHRGSKPPTRRHEGAREMKKTRSLIWMPMGVGANF